MELKQNTAVRVPVRLISSVDGNPWTGVTYNQAVVYVQKQNGAATLKTLGPTDWYEIDASNMPGLYDLVLSSGDTDTLGFMKYYVGGDLVLGYVGLMQIVANIEADTYTRLGTPAGASVSADIAGVGTSVTTLMGRALGLLLDNVSQDQQVFDQSGKLTSARLRCYDSAANAQAAGSTGLLYTYNITAAYDQAGNATLFRMTRG